MTVRALHPTNPGYWGCRGVSERLVRSAVYDLSLESAVSGEGLPTTENPFL